MRTHPVLRPGDTIPGMASLLFTISTACGGKAALMEDMVVRPQLRNIKLGAMLLEGAIGFARAQNCLRITLLTDHVNQPAIRFYRRHGFMQSGMIPLRLALDDPGG